jgi:hypothetical protein
LSQRYPRKRRVNRPLTLNELAELLRNVRPGDVVNIDHGRLNVGVAHERLNVMGRPDLNREGPERMP